MYQREETNYKLREGEDKGIKRQLERGYGKRVRKRERE